MSVVVTGACGHLGVNLVQALVAAGADVRALDPAPRPAAARLWGAGVPFVAADICEPATLPAAFEGADAVFHLAARISVAGDPDGSVRRVNVDGTRNVARAALAAGVRRLVHCSSVHAYDTRGLAGRPLTEDGPPAADPALPAYDRSKAAGEAALAEFAVRGLDVVVLQPTGMIGPVDPEPSRMGRLLRAAMAGRMPIVVAGAFDWVDVRDVVAAFLAAAAAGPDLAGRRLLLPGHRATVAQIVGLAAVLAGRRPPRAVLPAAPVRLIAEGLVRAVGPRGAGRLLLTPESLAPLLADPRVDGSEAARLLGYRSRPLDETVADLHRSFRDAGLLPRSA